MDRVRIGLIGCGPCGESHLQSYRAVPRAEVAAVFDTKHSRARQIASQFGIPNVCESPEEICGRRDLAAIDVVTPEHAHNGTVRMALAAGKHLFVENRFETKYAMLKDEIASGRLGKAVPMHARRNRPKSLLPLYDRSHPALENCAHDAVLMLWYTGRAVQDDGYQLPNVSYDPRVGGCARGVIESAASERNVEITVRD